MQHSSGIIKPDGIARHFEKEIFEWMEKTGLKVVFQKNLILKKKDVKVLYEYCYDMPQDKELERFLMSGPVVFYVVSPWRKYCSKHYSLNPKRKKSQRCFFEGN